MSAYQIVISDQLHPSGWDMLLNAPGVTLKGPFTSRNRLLRELKEADALIVRSTTQVDQALLACAPCLRVVARAGARLGNIDVDACTRRGILVIHAPNANLYAIAEHTFALLLALARGVPQAHQAVRSGRWPRHTMLGFQLYGKTLGIIGLGKIGRAVAQRAQAFGMRVLAYDPFVDLSFAQEQNVEIVNLDELLRRADIVSLHTALTPQTRGLLDAAAFEQMKPGAYLVNCTDSGLVDEDALLAALESGQLAGAALDTFEKEPPGYGHPLTRHPRVVVSPHLNQNTVESQTALSQQIAQDVLAALDGEDFCHTANLPFNDNLPYKVVSPYINLAYKLGKLQGQLAEGWITRVEVELLGEGLHDLMRPVTAVLLSGIVRARDGMKVNWVSAPVLAYEQGIVTAQAKGLVEQADYPNLMVCRIYWEGGQRTVAGTLFGNGEARLVWYDYYPVDAYPEGYVLVLENDDVPGVIGKVGVRLGRAGVNIAQWRYGREGPGLRAVSFINLDSRAPHDLLVELEKEPEIRRAKLVRL